jgi:hypothetical protein
MGEMMVYDMTRKGFIEGVAAPADGHVRPGKPTARRRRLPV